MCAEGLNCFSVTHCCIACLDHISCPASSATARLRAVIFKLLSFFSFFFLWRSDSPEICLSTIVLFLFSHGPGTNSANMRSAGRKTAHIAPVWVGRCLSFIAKQKEIKTKYREKNTEKRNKERKIYWWAKYKKTTKGRPNKALILFCWDLRLWHVTFNGGFKEEHFEMADARKSLIFFLFFSFLNTLLNCSM